MMLPGKVAMRDDAISEVEREAMKEPIYWFARLEQARDRGDLMEAAEAVRQLRALGIDLRDRRTGVKQAR